MDKAAYGLLGVVIGFFLTFVKDWWFERRRIKKEAEFLSIQMIYLLERFISGCAEVVSDDGLCHGQTDKGGYRSIQVSAPEFNPSEVEVKWKSLPTNLMYELLNFPSSVEATNFRISGAFEYAATPPDFDEGFEERQCQYAKTNMPPTLGRFKVAKYLLAQQPITNSWV